LAVLTPSPNGEGYNEEGFALDGGKATIRKINLDKNCDYVIMLQKTKMFVAVGV
jgi:hypothetical protein